MLSEIDQHPEVTLIITKDLSRLGRNMSESSYYAEQYFAERGIRYLAINDGFDSEKVDIMTPFRLATNEVYIRDTSNKVRSVLKDKREKGEYCACPPFGYRKDPANKGRLVPDSKTAPIVQMIFELAAQGQSARAIAITLTQKRCITPLKYRVLYRDDFCEKGAERATDNWNHTTVKRILKNQVYLGHTILGKTKKMSFKSKKKLDVPQEEWAITQNTHTPLVSQEQFDLAAKFMGMNTKRWQENEACRISVFNGVVFCKSCGSAMCSGGSVYKGEREKYWYLCCQNIPTRSKHHCEHGARIKYADLYQIVKEELNTLISLNDNEVKKLVKKAIGATPKIYSANRSAVTLENRLKTIYSMMLKLYEDNVNGLIDDERLHSMSEALNAQAKALREELESLLAQSKTQEKLEDAYSAFFNLAKSFTSFDELTPEIVRTFIDRIEIGEKHLEEGRKVASHNSGFTQEIKIYYRFIGDMAPKNIEYSKGTKSA